MQNVEINGDDLQVATSPCLESVTLRYEAKEEEFENYNYDALLEMIAGAAPNLRHVTLESGGEYRCTQGHTNSTDPNLQHPWGPRKPWRADIFPKPQPPSSKALKGLDIRRWMNKNDLIVLSNKTDFSLLRSLHIQAGVEELCWLTCRLSSLQTLDINLGERNGINTEELHPATKTFFLSLPPLKHLTLRGTWTSDTLEVILGRHGPTLLSLFCPVCTSPIDVELVQACCTVLEELSIPIQRTQGDFQEVAMYRALGQLPARTVTLSLRQTDPVHTRKHFSERRQLWDPVKPLHAHFSGDEIRDLLVNCAVDEDLSQSIFVQIASRREQMGLPILETLNLHPENLSPLFFRHGYPRALLLPIAHLYRSWSCVRNPRDDCATTMCAVKRGPPPGSSLPPGVTLTLGVDPVGECIKRGLDYDTLDPKVEEVLRRIWPGSSPWQDICHSLPLAGQTE
ncbi:uncharacterized protein RCC_04271 [Ramularia collo-cygni]|uniref:Uncharacterized protein n=1 Tax=Ramularia collo-cygni TaxID=112498 RepID=A0A2D3V4G2_9PEZI|nr:uncharacterized protein RCC_04271 [Ramularia collo-cygni]CZT18426.1 uncharacterized protein RCC_04271 [Ramularia collo-cygni]